MVIVTENTLKNPPGMPGVKAILRVIMIDEQSATKSKITGGKPHPSHLLFSNEGSMHPESIFRWQKRNEMMQKMSKIRHRACKRIILDSYV
jgi:hypothetical protein